MWVKKMKQIKLLTEFITLQQILKMENVIQSGGEAKFFLASHQVYVNQELEQRRGRKLYPKDVVQILGKEYRME